MDHHCVVLGSCIAANNYKSFFLTLIYCSLLLNFMFFTSFKMIYFYTEEFNVNKFIIYFNLFFS
jgi:hypothetical protein